MRKLGFLSQNNDITKVKKTKETLKIPIDYRHSIGIGETGCGKTSSYIYPSLNKRIKKQHGVLLYDYKGKEHAAVKAIADRHDRLQEVLEVGVPWGASINIIKYLNEGEIRDFALAILGLDKSDPYWSTTGSNIVVSIWKAKKLMLSVLEASKDLGIEKNLISTFKIYKLDISLTMKSIATVCESISNIVEFFDKTLRLKKAFRSYMEDIVNNEMSNTDDIEIITIHKMLAMRIIEFTDLIDETLRPLKIFKDAEDESRKSTTYQTIITALTTTLATIASVSELNDDSVDLVEELNNQKIVVINTSRISSEVLSHFSNSLLYELSKRVTKKNIKGISVFIDEAQRVLNADSDLHTDILREAKVEIILAVQNINLLIESMTENKFYSLFQNLTKKYYFSNGYDTKEHKLKKLKKFEYYKENDRISSKAKPKFLKDEVIFDAQLKYFKLNDIYNKYGLEEHEDKNILVYNSHLFENNKILIESVDGSSVIIDLIDNELEIKAFEYIDLMISVANEYGNLSRSDLSKIKYTKKKEKRKKRLAQDTLFEEDEYSDQSEYDEEAYA